MKINVTPQMVAVAERLAGQNGVSVRDVLEKFSAGVKKTALTKADFFWGTSDISLRAKKVSDVRPGVVARRVRAASK